MLTDPATVARCVAAPASGPRILFLSGGSALRAASRALKRLTHNSIHLITPFDSGGSSAPLRVAFGMPSVGDLRNRLLALADEETPASSQLQKLFGHRLPRRAAPDELSTRLDDLIAGRDALMAEVPEAHGKFAREQLARFAAAKPSEFDLSGASVGNLVLAGSYLASGSLVSAVEQLGSVLGVRGHVLPVVDVDLHLEARLEDGSRVRGQHRMTGKEGPALEAPIEELRLIEMVEDDRSSPATPRAAPAVCDLIRSADLICFPMGSFYSSVVCNLLPTGIGRAIREARCPKVYVPSTGHDPELPGVDPGRAATRLLSVLRADAGEDANASELLSAVLLDQNTGAYANPPDLELLETAGIGYRSAELVAPEEQVIDPNRLAEILISWARNANDD